MGRRAPPASTGTLSIEVVDRILEVDEQEWDRLLEEDDPPFLEWRFLASLEAAQTLGEAHGWLPRYVLVKRLGQLVAAAPTYVKLHSQGEFVFDHAWANLASQLGVPYFPKLLVGIPFTPVTGRRLLTSPGEDRPALVQALAEVLVQLATSLDCSSVHINFLTREESELLAGVGYLPRLGLQYHWFRHDERDFEDYLRRFNSKRRNQLKRELREVEAQGLELVTIPGAVMTPALVETAFRLYLTTVEKFYWGRQYLNLRAFQEIVARMPDRFELVAAREKDGEIVAGAVNFQKGQKLYGRYWGAFKDVKHLHFNVCYYRGVEECFRRGLDVFEPGAGGEHKLVRGFEPTLTYSVHHLADPRLRGPIARHLIGERAAVEREREALLAETGGRQVELES